MRRAAIWLAVLMVLGAALGAEAQLLGQQYPGDVNIENDADTLMVERFEDTTVGPVSNRLIGTTVLCPGGGGCGGPGGTDAQGTMGQSRNSAGMSMSIDVPTGSPGTRSLQMQVTGPGQAYFLTNIVDKIAACTTTPCNEVFFRWIVKYVQGTWHHAGLWLLANGVSDPDFVMSTCCDKPSATDPRAYVGIEYQPTPQLDAYTGWPSGRYSGIHTCDLGADNTIECFFGNTFINNNITMALNQWHTLEARWKKNSAPGVKDGELQIWLNGVELVNLIQGSPLGAWGGNVFNPGGGSEPFEGFDWIATAAQKLTNVWFLMNADQAPAGQVVQMRWDHFVMARRRIGPLVAIGADSTPPTIPQNPTCAPTGSTTANCSFSASTDAGNGVSHYLPERAPGPACSSWTALPQIAHPTTAFTMTGLTANTQYCMRVSASDGTNISSPSSTATFTTLAARSLNFSFTDVQPDGTNQETGFKITRSTGPGETFTLVTTLGPKAGTGAVTFNDTAAPSPTACYKAAATNSAGDSSPDTVCGTTGCCHTAQVANTLFVDKTSMSFSAQVGSGNPASQPLAIQNLTGSGMAWTVSDNANWLSVAPTSGTDAAGLTVSINHVSCATDCPLAAGTHNATITVSAPGATGTPKTVAVQLSLAPASTPGGTAPGTARGGRIR